MSLSRDSRAERTLKTIRRAQFRLRQAIDRINWEEDFLQPEIEAMKSGKSILGLPEGASIEFEVAPQHENSDPPAAGRKRLPRSSRRRAN